MLLKRCALGSGLRCGHVRESVELDCEGRSLVELEVVLSCGRDRDGATRRDCDRVLGLVVAELICKRYDRESEGDIARRFNRLVRKEACAAIARAIDLGDHLVLSSGEEESGGRDKDNILADACEAVMGAMYLDGGFETARGVIRRHWTKLIETWNSPAADPKTALQEWAQGRGLRLPAYREIGREGPAHQPRFTTEVVVEGEKPAAGEGPSKRAAEQAAALALLRRLGIVDATP